MFTLDWILVTDDRADRSATPSVPIQPSTTTEPPPTVLPETLFPNEAVDTVWNGGALADR